MFLSVGKLWTSFDHAGVFAAQSKRERKSIVVLNRAWMVILTIQVSCLVSHIINGLERSALMTGFYVAGLIIVHILMRIGRINAAKISAMVVINYNTFLMAIFLGPQTHVIDFLLLTALMPLYLFEIKNRRLIFCGMAVSIVPFVLYHYGALQLFSSLQLPEAEQLNIYKSTVWVLVASLSALLYLIFQKNADYEVEVQETENQLREQKRLYERVLEQIPIDIVTFDKELKYTYINSAAVKDAELRKWLIGKTNLDYFKKRNLDPEMAKEREKILHEALAKGKKIETEESLVDRHGMQKTTIKGASPVYSDDKSELLCIIGYSLDISSIKEAERKMSAYAVELERKNEDLQHFVHATSHDLKSPLRNIASYLQLLEKKNKAKLDDESLGLMAYTVKSVKHLNRLISDIYQYSVADRHNRPDEITDVNKVMEDVLRQISGMVAEKKAVVQFNRLPVLKASNSQLNQVLTNLVVNGLKYNNSEAPRITIDCKSTATEYVFSVSDNGIGIASEYNKQIFEIFRRLHTVDVYEGTGVGLAICKKIVENYGGKIWVESEQGNGSTFFFSLSKAIVSSFDAQSPDLPAYNQYAIAG